MKCPHCGATHIKTIETRQTTSYAVSRKRACAICGEKWATAEIVVQRRHWASLSHPRGGKGGIFGVSPPLLSRLQELSLRLYSEESAD
jgi:hypothetical protein